MSTWLPWTIYSLCYTSLFWRSYVSSQRSHLGQNQVQRPQHGLHRPPWYVPLLPLWPLAIPLSPLLPCCVLTCEIYICHFLCLKRMSQDMHMACSPEKSRRPLINLNILSQPTSNSIQVPYPPIDNTQPASFFFTAFIPPEILCSRMKLKVNRRLIHLLTGIPNA